MLLGLCDYHQQPLKLPQSQQIFGVIGVRTSLHCSQKLLSPYVFLSNLRECICVLNEGLEEAEPKPFNSLSTNESTHCLVSHNLNKGFTRYQHFCLFCYELNLGQNKDEKVTLPISYNQLAELTMSKGYPCCRVQLRLQMSGGSWVTVQY